MNCLKNLENSFPYLLIFIFLFFVVVHVLDVHALYGYFWAMRCAFFLYMLKPCFSVSFAGSQSATPLLQDASDNPDGGEISYSLFFFFLI